MINLNCKRNKFDIVISDVTRCKRSLTKSLSLLNKCGGLYYMILHDKDVGRSSHYHIVLVFDSSKRVSTILNLMQDVFNTNFENVQVMEVVSIIGAVQYLTHKNDANKHQYHFEDILTNDKVGLLNYYNSSYGGISELSFDILYDLIFVEELNKVQLMKKIGINLYQHYYKVIDTLYKGV